MDCEEFLYYRDPGSSDGALRIEILKAAPNTEALKRIAVACSLVLPSRCNGRVERVLIEEMGVIGGEMTEREIAETRRVKNFSAMVEDAVRGNE